MRSADISDVSSSGTRGEAGKNCDEACWLARLSPECSARIFSDAKMPPLGVSRAVAGFFRSPSRGMMKRNSRRGKKVFDKRTDTDKIKNASETIENEIIVNIKRFVIFPRVALCRDEYGQRDNLRKKKREGNVISVIAWVNDVRQIGSALR